MLKIRGNLWKSTYFDLKAEGQPSNKWPRMDERGLQHGMHVDINET